MVFGLSNVPAKFLELMETCVGDFHLRECHILYDILVLSWSFDDHLKRSESAYEKSGKT